MIGALQAAADALAVTAPDVASGVGKGLEAEVLFEFALAAAAHGIVEARTHKDRPLTGRFRLRGGPGRLVDPAASGMKPCFFHVTVQDREYELHNSLEYSGESGATHEVDVSALPAWTAQVGRQSGDLLPPGPPTVGVELKEYAATTLAKNLVRAFLACVVDFIPAWPMGEATLLVGGRPVDVAPRPRPDDQFWFVTTASLSADSIRLAEAYDLQLVDTVSGSSLTAAAQRMAGRLLHDGHPVAPPPPPPPPGPSGRRIRVLEWRARSSSPRLRRRILILDDD